LKTVAQAQALSTMNCGSVYLLAKIRRNVAGHASLVGLDIGKQQVVADPDDTPQQNLLVEVGRFLS
jgi:hypothetical protein